MVLAKLAIVLLVMVLVAEVVLLVFVAAKVAVVWVVVCMAVVCVYICISCNCGYGSVCVVLEICVVTLVMVVISCTSMFDKTYYLLAKELNTNTILTIFMRLISSKFIGSYNIPSLHGHTI